MRGSSPWVANRDLWHEGDRRSFLLTPREEFCVTSDANRVYDTGYPAIGYGATITGRGLLGA